MQSANRIGVSDCGTRDPRFRPYWVNDCQKDMNPADPRSSSGSSSHLKPSTRSSTTPTAYVMIDSDPGGWPQSPLSDQARIFQAARRLLDQYAVPRDTTDTDRLDARRMGAPQVLHVD